MSQESRDEFRVERAHKRLDEHAESLEHHDRRISRNENWRLQAQGALKVLALILGGGALTFVIQAAIGLF